jgi:hypothetical protein
MNDCSDVLLERPNGIVRNVDWESKLGTFRVALNRKPLGRHTVIKVEVLTMEYCHFFNRLVNTRILHALRSGTFLHSANEV